MNQNGAAVHRGEHGADATVTSLTAQSSGSATSAALPQAPQAPWATAKAMTTAAEMTQAAQMAQTVTVPTKPEQPKPTKPKSAQSKPAQSKPAQPKYNFVRRALLSLGAAACGMVVAAGAAYALWAADAPFLGGPVIAGDLQLAAGKPAWEQVTPGVQNPVGGDLLNTPADFHTMPGDVIKITQPITTFLRGDNIVGGLTVNYNDADAVVGDIETSFHIEDTNGNVVAPAGGKASFGEVLLVPGLVGDNDGESGAYNVVITVSVLGNYAWTDQPAGTNPGSWAAGYLDVQLKQVREGDGYVAEGAE